MGRWDGHRRRGELLRSYHRKTLVKKESWPLVDGWYWCPMTVVEERIKKERAFVKMLRGLSSMPFAILRWEQDQKQLDQRLAHACHDGKIRAPSGYGVEKFRTQGGIVRIYGKCRFCDEILSDGIKLIIIIEEEP